MTEAVKQEGYSKRPLWQWVVFYVVLGIIIYGLIYYFVLGPKGNYSQIPVPQATVPTTSQSEAPTNNIYLTKTDAAKGTYMTDFQGMTLYTFDKDTKGVSNCSSTCIALWPFYTSGAVAEKLLPDNITVITRTDGAKQFAWKGMPLYYYAKDKKAGDIFGDGVGGIWHIVKL